MNKTLHKLFILTSLMLISVIGLNVRDVACAQLSQMKGLSCSNICWLVDNGLFAKTAVSRQQKVKSKEVQSDSSSKENTLKVWENSTGEVLLSLNLKESNQYIEIQVWNMLGKVVISDYKGTYSGLEKEHVIKNASSLARGAYLVRMTGNKCKLDAKFIKMR